MKKLLVGIALALVASASQMAFSQTAVQDNGRAGPTVVSDGQQVPLRLERSGGLVNVAGHGRYQEPTYRGNVYTLDSDSITLAAAHATKGVLPASVKFINGFYNPTNSGKAAVILNANVSTVSGTPAGPYFWNYICGYADSPANTGTIRGGIIGQGAGAMQPRANIALTFTGSNPTMIQYGLLGGPAAIAAGAGMYTAMEDLGGRIIVPPGCDFGINATGAGTSHVVQSTLVWEEINWP